MNGNFDGGRGMYGLVLLGALAELGSLWSKPGKRQNGQYGLSGKRVALVLAAIAMPLALLAGRLGS